MERVLDQLTVFATEYGLKIVGAILILVLGRIGSGIARRLVKKILEKAGTDATVTSFAASFAYVLVLAFAVLAALAKFGIETASIIAVFAAAGFAVGFALHDVLIPITGQEGQLGEHAPEKQVALAAHAPYGQG